MLMAISFGLLYSIDDSGKETTELGGAGCNSASISRNGLIACVTAATGAVTVRDETGKLVWTPHVDGWSIYSLVISPDGQGISDDGQVETHAGGMVRLPSGFRVQGWLDKNTIVGRVEQQNGGEGNLSWISLAHPSTLHDLGFKGDFVATLA